MKLSSLLILLFLLSSFNVWAQNKKVAVVKVARGEVELLTLGKTTKLKVEDWVEDGAIIKTSDRSFVKLIFIDKSQMNIGPNSEMKIEKFSANDSGVIDLVKGKIRSQVTKDYLQIENKGKSKLFIKTPNAVMGIRGTDFMITTNGQNTAAVLFEGEVVFNKLDSRGLSSSDRLEEVVDRGVRMHPGEFSVVEQHRSQPTLPAVLNVEQREALESNDSFDKRAPSNSGNEEAKKSVVPEGLDGQKVSNDALVVKNDSATSGANSAAASNPDGFVSGDKIKPANGSFLHVDSGVIIPPGETSVYDKNTNSYIPGPESGKVTGDGSYVPPKNIEITSDGKVLVAVNSGGQIKVQEIEKPSPVKSNNGGLGSASQFLANNPQLVNGGKVVTNDILNKQFAPGGLNDLSNNKQNSSGTSAGEQQILNQGNKAKTNISVSGP